MKTFSMQADSCLAELGGPPGGELFGQVRISCANRDFVLAEVGRAFAPVCEALGVDASANTLAAYAEDFLLGYVPTIPDRLRQVHGATPIEGLLPLYLLVRAARPDVIVESGVFVGSSLRMMRAAAPAAEIFAFDVSFRSLVERDSSVTYHEDDWVTFDGLPEGGLRFAFFDDHINTAKRVVESRERDFTLLAFDDSPDFGRLYRYRYPAVPSIPMITNAAVPDGVTFEWRHEPTASNLRFRFDRAEADRARACIRSSACLDVFERNLGVTVGDKYGVRIGSR